MISLIASWILAIGVITIVCGLIMALVMLVVQMFQVKKIIKNVPANMKDIIAEEEKRKTEVENGREQTRRERQRRTIDETSPGYSREQKQSIQSRNVEKDTVTREPTVKSSGNNGTENNQGNQSVVRKTRRI